MITIEEMQNRINLDAISNTDLLVNIMTQQKGITTKKKIKWNAMTHEWEAEEVYNVPCSFDIETTGDTESKTAYMYHWQFNFYGWTTCGRTWESYYNFIKTISRVLKLGTKRRLVVYIHNYAYEFSFMGPRETIETLFATDERKPLYMIDSYGIEYRDSYILAGESLDEVGKSLTSLHILKKTGDLDYSIPRNSKTPLTREELEYCWNDVKVLSAYIYEQMKQYGENINNIPLTNTGRVREFMRNKCLKIQVGKKTEKNIDYKIIMDDLTITEEEYNAMKKAYQGGFTHAGHMNAGKVCKHVYSVDFTSSYPGVECADYVPMGRGVHTHYDSIQAYMNDCKEYCVVAMVELTNIREKFKYEHYLTAYKALTGTLKNVQEDNGRIISADRMVLWCTEIDLQIIAKCYSCNIRVLDAYRYDRGYLPREVIESVLDLYQDKTTLKDIEGREAEYALKKGMLNSNYGMMVTDITNPEIYYNYENAEKNDDVWGTIPCDYAKQIQKYNESGKRFLFYGWGVYITAHARERLWRGIFECGADYIYSDTDSIKFMNMKKHKKFFEDYNKEVQEDIKNVCNIYRIDPAKAAPLTVSRETKPLGVWDYEGYYDKFKTLGAKRYIVQGYHRPDGTLKKEHMVTIAGLNKKTGGDYIFSQKEAFEFFKAGMVIPKEYAGRTVSYYTDKPCNAVITDKYGNTEEMNELSCVYIGNSDYNMNIVKNYEQYIMNNRDGAGNNLDKIIGSLQSYDEYKKCKEGK